MMKKSVKKNEQPSKGSKSVSKTVKVSKQEVAIPAAIQTYFKPTMPKFSTRADGGVRMSGSDLLDFVPLANDTTGSVLRRINMNPQDAVFANTRLGIESLRFEKYRFTKMCFHWLPEMPTSQKGSIIMAYDPDAADDPQGLPPSSSQESLASIQNFMAYRDSEQFNLWLPAALDCKVKLDPQKFYYTNYSGGDIRLAQQGSFFVVLGGSTGVSGGTTIGKIAFKWEIEFFEPTLENVNPQSKVSLNASVAFSSSPGQGFNNVTDNNIDQTNNGPELVVDAVGNKYWELIPGVYEAASTLVVNGSTVPDVTYTLLPNITTLVGSVTDLVNAFNNNSSTSMRAEVAKITVPQGGGRLYATLNAALTNVGWTWKIAKVLSNLVL